MFVPPRPRVGCRFVLLTPTSACSERPVKPQGGQGDLRQFDTNRIECSEFSSTAAATLPKYSVSPAGRPTLSLLKSPQSRERLEIFAGRPYRHGHGDDSLRPWFDRRDLAAIGDLCQHDLAVSDRQTGKSHTRHRSSATLCPSLPQADWRRPRFSRGRGEFRQIAQNGNAYERTCAPPPRQCVTS
jgi:hypothetical protein